MPFVANYHTHTYRCEHASGDCLDYAKVAAAAGLAILGFSDHTPLPDGRWDDMRMSLAQFDEYEAAFAAAQAAFPNMLVGTAMRSSANAASTTSSPAVTIRRTMGGGSSRSGV
jgi:histidinol phosphatase-like PHP family hydrolase